MTNERQGSLEVCPHCRKKLGSYGWLFSLVHCCCGFCCCCCCCCCCYCYCCLLVVSCSLFVGCLLSFLFFLLFLVVCWLFDVCFFLLVVCWLFVVFWLFVVCRFFCLMDGLFLRSIDVLHLVTCLSYHRSDRPNKPKTRRTMTMTIKKQ